MQLLVQGKKAYAPLRELLISNNYLLCTSRKYPYLPREGQYKFQGSRGEWRMSIGVQTKTTLCERGVDVNWNNAFLGMYVFIFICFMCMLIVKTSASLHESISILPFWTFILYSCHAPNLFTAITIPYLHCDWKRTETYLFETEGFSHLVILF